MRRRKLMHRQGHPHLRVITFGRPGHHKIGRRPTTEQLRQPLFHNGLAVAARDAHHRNLELLPVPRRLLLHKRQHIRHIDKLSINPLANLRNGPVDHKLPNALLVEVADKPVSVVVVAANGEENGLCGHQHLSRIGKPEWVHHRHIHFCRRK